MKKKGLCIFLGLEGILCLALYAARAALPGFFTAAWAFPFEQIGLGLRALSLSGGLGNGLAVGLYAALCLAPIGALAVLWKKKQLRPADALLAVLSFALFYVLYLMVNPGMILVYEDLPVAEGINKALLGGMVYAILAGYLILRVMGSVTKAETDRLQKYLTVLLGAVQILLVYQVCGTCFGDMLDSFASVRGANTGNEGKLGLTYLLLALKFLVTALPYALNVFVIFAGRSLLEELGADRYSARTVAAADDLAKGCGRALTAAVAANILFNLLQMLCMGRLAVVSSVVEIPLGSIAFVLGTLLLARSVRERKRLKDDNDMFI